MSMEIALSSIGHIISPGAQNRFVAEKICSCTLKSVAVSLSVICSKGDRAK